MPNDPNEADEILNRAASRSQRKTVFEAWLEKEEAAAELFWDVMQRGYVDGGMAFLHVFEAWKERYPDAPAPVSQTVKRIVDARLR